MGGAHHFGTGEGYSAPQTPQLDSTWPTSNWKGYKKGWKRDAWEVQQI